MDYLKSFLIGGAICALGQVITELWVMSGLPRADAGTACSMTLVFLGALCTGLGVYDDAAKFGGAGTLVCKRRAYTAFGSRYKKAAEVQR